MKKNIFMALALTGILMSCEGSGKTFSEQEQADKTVKVGVLFSLNGHLSYSETVLKDAVLMAVEEINDDGGVLGKRIEAVVSDPGSETRSYERLATRLFDREKIAVLFGCQTSESRKAVLPVLREHEGLMFYPAPYEGQENAAHIVYLGATPNQQIAPALKYLLESAGQAYTKFYLLGTESIYSHEVHALIRSQLSNHPIQAAQIAERYVPAALTDFEEVVREIRHFCTKGRIVIINTIAGNTNIAFYKEFANQGLSSAICPIMSFLLTEEELRHMETEFITGHLSSRNYFQTVESDKNIRFVSSYKLYCAIQELPGGIDRVTTDGVAWAYTGVHLWKRAVEKAGSFEPEKVRQALYGMKYNSPAGLVQIDSASLQLMKPVFIGESQADGLFEVVWQSDSLVGPAVNIGRTALRMPENSLAENRLFKEDQ